MTADAERCEQPLRFLAPKQRADYRAVVKQDQPVSDRAHERGVTVEAVHHNVARARERLRQIAEERDEGFVCPSCSEPVGGFWTGFDDRVHVQPCGCVVPASEAPFYQPPGRDPAFEPQASPDAGDSRLEPAAGGERR